MRSVEFLSCIDKNLIEKNGVRNVKDHDDIKSVLKETEDKPSAIPGKTFGDLIREGRLPASK